MYDALIKCRKTWYFLLSLTVIIVSMPLFSSDLIYGHDMAFHLARIEGIKAGLLNGDFPVKLYGYICNDYGYPAGYFYPDLFLYIPALFRLIGLDVVYSYHFFLFLITSLTAFIAWISFNKLFSGILRENELPYYVYGAVAAILYTGALYRLMDLYPRAAIGEAIAMAFLPLALIGFYLTLKGVKNAWIGVVIGTSGVLEAHILSSVLLFAAYVVISLVFYKNFFKREVLKSVMKASVFTLLLNLWFYAPFLSMYETFDFHMKNYVRSASNLFVFPWELLFYSCHLFVGILPTAILCVYAVYRMVKIFREQHILFTDKIFFVCFILFVILLILISPVIPWNLVDTVPIIGEKLGVLQSSYRFTMFTTIFMVIALSIVICASKKFLATAFIIPLITIFWMMSLPVCFENFMTAICTESNSLISDRFLELRGTAVANIKSSSLLIAHRPELANFNDYMYNDISETEYKFYTDLATKEYWDAVKNGTLLKPDPYEVTPKDAVTDFSREGLHLNFTTNTDKPTEIKLPLWYYPHSYEATDGGEELPVSEVYHHRLAVTVPEGEHNIKVFPKLHTPYRNACIISLIGLLAFIFVCVYAFKREKE